MASKLRTAQRLATYGIPTIVAAGGAPEALERILRGDDVGTLFMAAGARGNNRKHWIAYTLKSKGRLLLDDGAVAALTTKGKSLLPSGVREVQGRFEAGDAVSCCDAAGREVAKGLVNYASDAVAKLCGAKTGEIRDRIGYKDYDEIIHRDNLVILVERT
jgi:glutamate 5-kinase